MEFRIGNWMKPVITKVVSIVTILEVSYVLGKGVLHPSNIHIELTSVY